MVRRLARGLAGLSASYQGIVGLLLIGRPAVAGSLYQLQAQSAESLALCRILGALMVGNALASAVFSRDPESSSALAPVLLVGSGVNVTADLVACGAGEIGWKQVAGPLVFQSALAAALVAYILQARSSEG